MKKSIPCGCRTNYRPCWDVKCEALYQAFLRAPQGKGSNTAASALPARLNKTLVRGSQCHRLHTLQPAGMECYKQSDWQTRQSYCPFPISANSIALQLVKNGTYKTNDREFTRLMLKEVSELWKLSTPADKCISSDFSPEEFARSL